MFFNHNSSSRPPAMENNASSDEESFELIDSINEPQARENTPEITTTELLKSIWRSSGDQNPRKHEESGAVEETGKTEDGTDGENEKTNDEAKPVASDSLEERRTVTISRGDHGQFGFVLQRDEIATVFFGSAAFDAGLKEGDQILAVNGTDVRSLSHYELGSLLATVATSPTTFVVRYNMENLAEVRAAIAKVGVQALTLRKDEIDIHEGLKRLRATNEESGADEDTDNTEAVTDGENEKTNDETDTMASDSMEEPRTIIISRAPDELFGFVLFGDAITTVLWDSPASYAGLKKGDQLLAVNGVDVQSLSHQEIKALLVNATYHITLLVRYNLERVMEAQAEMAEIEQAQTGSTTDLLITDDEIGINEELKRLRTENEELKKTDAVLRATIDEQKVDIRECLMTVDELRQELDALRALHTEDAVKLIEYERLKVDMEKINEFNKREHILTLEMESWAEETAQQAKQDNLEAQLQNVRVDNEARSVENDVIEVSVNELPKMDEILSILSDERAKLHIWITTADVYYEQKRFDTYLKILELSVSAATHNYPGFERDQARVVEKLSAYYSEKVYELTTYVNELEIELDSMKKKEVKSVEMEQVMKQNEKLREELFGLKSGKEHTTVTLDTVDQGFFGFSHIGTSISFVVPEGPAESNGVLRGDQLISVDGINVETRSEDEISYLFEQGRANGTVTMVMRQNPERLKDLEKFFNRT